MSQSDRVLPLGPSCAFLLGAAILLRIFGSFLPCETWGPSGYLCAAPYLNLNTGKPHTCVAEKAIPEGARLSNRIAFLNFRHEQFTLDKRGLRNGPQEIPAQPLAVLFGSSFSLGLALSDDQTLSAQLNRELGPVIYNAALTFSTDLFAQDMVKSAKASGLDHGWILFEVTNRAPLSYRSPSLSSSLLRRSDRYFPRLMSRYRQAKDELSTAATPLVSLERRIEYSYPLARAAALLNMRIQNGRFLPNPFHDLYAEEELLDGRHVLFFSGDKAYAQKPASPQDTAAALRQLSAELEAQGFHLAVVLLPNSYSSSVPLLRSRPATDAGPAYFSELSNQLTANQIAVLNLLPTLREAAQREFAHGRLLYYPDDAHWNPQGCRTAAKAVAAWLRPLILPAPAPEPLPVPAPQTQHN